MYCYVLLLIFINILHCREAQRRYWLWKWYLNSHLWVPYLLISSARRLDSNYIYHLFKTIEIQRVYVNQFLWRISNFTAFWDSYKHATFWFCMNYFPQDVGFNLCTEQVNTQVFTDLDCRGSGLCTTRAALTKWFWNTFPCLWFTVNCHNTCFQQYAKPLRFINMTIV